MSEQMVEKIKVTVMQSAFGICALNESELLKKLEELVVFGVGLGRSSLGDGWMPIANIDECTDERVLVWVENLVLGSDAFIGSFGDDGSWAIDGIGYFDSAEQAFITHYKSLPKKPVASLEQGGV